MLNGNYEVQGLHNGKPYYKKRCAFHGDACDAVIFWNSWNTQTSHGDDSEPGDETETSGFWVLNRKGLSEWKKDNEFAYVFTGFDTSVLIDWNNENDSFSGKVSDAEKKAHLQSVYGVDDDEAYEDLFKNDEKAKWRMLRDAIVGKNQELNRREPVEFHYGDYRDGVEMALLAYGRGVEYGPPPSKGLSNRVWLIPVSEAAVVAERAFRESTVAKQLRMEHESEERLRQASNYPQDAGLLPYGIYSCAKIKSDARYLAQMREAQDSFFQYWVRNEPLRMDIQLDKMLHNTVLQHPVHRLDPIDRL